MSLLGHSMALRELFERVRQRGERDFHYGVYWSGTAADPQLDDNVLLAEPIAVDRDDAEVLPESVIQAGYELLCSDELIQDVVDHAESCRPGVSTVYLLSALIHYLDHDDFLDAGGQSP